MIERQKTRISDDQFREMAIAHLLRELSARAEATFAAELMRRGEPGHAILREIQEPLGDLALAVEPAEPPPSLRGRVLSDVPPPAPREAPPEVRRSPWPWAAAMALAALAIGAGLWGARLTDERDRMRVAVERLEDRVSAAEYAAQRVAPLEQEVDWIGAPGTAVHDLAGTAAAPQASGRAFVDSAGGRILLYASGLPAIGREELYELWAISPGGIRAAAVFRPDREGRARLEGADPELGRDVQALIVTVEPDSGVAQPTGEIVLSSDRF